MGFRLPNMQRLLPNPVQYIHHGIAAFRRPLSKHIFVHNAGYGRECCELLFASVTHVNLMADGAIR